MTIKKSNQKLQKDAKKTVKEIEKKIKEIKELKGRKSKDGLFDDDSGTAEELEVGDDNHLFIIMGPIDDDTFKDFAEFILPIHEDEKDEEEIQLILMSPGGGLQAMFGIINLMEMCKNSIKTIAFGMNASAASMIFIAGDTRAITYSSMMMFHKFSGGSYGTYDDLISVRKRQDYNHDMMIDHIVNYSNLKDSEEVEDLVLQKNDVYLTPDELKKYGLCDMVYTRKDIRRSKLKKRK